MGGVGNGPVYQMKKIKILKSFPSTHYGYLSKGDEIEVSDQFASYVVKKMTDAAEFVKSEKKEKKTISLNKK